MEGEGSFRFFAAIGTNHHGLDNLMHSGGCLPRLECSEEAKDL